MALLAKIRRKAASFTICLRSHGRLYTLYHAMEKLAMRMWMPVAIALLFLLRILPAYHRYAALKKRSAGAHIYCQYFHGTGDVRYSAAYIKLLREAEPKQDKAAKDILLVSGKSAVNAAALFCPEDTQIIPWRYCATEPMVHFLRFAGQTVLDITILHYFDALMYTSICFPVMMRKNITFEDLYTIALLDDAKTIWPEPVWDDDATWAERIFRENGFAPHKTVLLSPYASSLAYGPNAKWWERVVLALKQRGFCVCTNASGRHEKPVRGSVGVHIPYRYLNIFCQRAGYFLAFRSGLCDLIESVPCRKVILYPDKVWPDAPDSFVRTIDFFSLKRMGYGADTEEFVYRQDMAPETVVQALLKL